jgi:glycosyltransferase involved in cell wall biosynthesis
MAKPFVSIIIPVFNARKTLRECLKAVNDSTYRNFEVILVDDLSTDDSLKIAQDFPCRIIELKKKGGPAAARNRGALEAKGEVLFFTDSDIIINRDTLHKIVAGIEGNSSVTGMYARKPYLKKFFSLYHNYYAHKSQKETSSSTFMFHTSCGAIRREVFNELGGFNENMKKATVEDVEFGYRLMEKGYKVYLDKDMQVTHFTDYSFLKLLKSYFLKSKDWAELLFDKRDRLVKNEGWANFKNVFILMSALLIIPLTFLSLYNTVFVPLLLICFVFFLYQNHDFYILILEEMPFKLIPGVAFNFLANLVLFLGIFSGLWSSLRKRVVNAA